MVAMATERKTKGKKNFKNLLVRNHETDFNIIWQKWGGGGGGGGGGVEDNFKDLYNFIHVQSTGTNADTPGGWGGGANIL